MAVRILHVVDNMGKGGVENGLANLIERLDAPSFQHIVCVMRHLGWNSDRLPPNVDVVQLGKENPRFQIRSILRQIRRFRPDIVHSRNWAGIEAVPAARIAGVHAIVHGEHGLDTGEDAREPWRRTVFRRVAYALADRVLCVSHQLRHLHSGRTRFPAARMTVIHNGVDMRRFAFNPAVRDRIRRELGVAEGEFCIGCVGNLTTVKDYPTLFRAVGHLAGGGMRFRVLVFGDGPDRGKLESFVQGHPDWAHRVSFQGLSNRIAESLNAFDAYVLTSLTEGISNSLLEAMATGRPVVVTDTGGNPEVVVNGDSGLLFPVGDSRRLADHLQTLAACPELRMRLGEGSLRRIRESFSIDSMVKAYQDVYCSLLPRERFRDGELQASRQA